MNLALRKRPVDEEKLDRAISSIIRQLELLGEAEITSDMIGAHAMDALYTLDKVGYVRYASVYRDFRDTGAFTAFVRDLQQRMQDESETGE